ncbi:hypothetical protein M422DRAFT_30145 [Sphaerobolus stellatus SS14]|uniref:Uncharacterized protein n=1 Tax=Sphaerobolus stellatus (strain SS14) TaxID=990650 RepID=A0A0C9W1B1_SPHS4|nr:hypothetical protein M422DRAFT_30145 [Sphaerobolus stellatus SS14]
MYALRKRIARPSGCLICAARVCVARRYASIPGSIDSGSSPGPDTAESSTSTAEATAVSSPKRRLTKSKKNKTAPLDESQQEEKRKRALATFNRSAKFIAENATAHSQGPTLADLDALKPEGGPAFTLESIYPNPSAQPPGQLHIPGPKKVEKYVAAFEKLMERLTATFSSKQLIELYAMGISKTFDPRYGKPPQSKFLKTRDRAAGLIRWRWLWPHPAEVQERQKYLSQRSERAFLLSNSELFLLLGSDGATLRELTEKYNVSVSNVKRVKDGITLVLEGLAGSLDAVGVLLAEQKKFIKHEDLPLTSPSSSTGSLLRSDLIPRISKLTGALVEERGNGIFRISAYDTGNITMAKRLVTRASQQMSLAPPALMAYIPTQIYSNETSVSQYALFPFELSTPEKSPFYWALIQTLTEPSSLDTLATPSYHIRQSLAIYSLYRARRVSNFMEQHEQDEIVRSSGLSSDRNRLIDISGQTSTLRTALGLPRFQKQDIPNTGIIVTAMFGHVVFAPKSRSLPLDGSDEITTGPSKSLLPSLQGSQEMTRIFDWIKTDANMTTFIPELPGLLSKSLPVKHTLLTRLVYRSPDPEEFVAGKPLKTLKFEFSRQEVPSDPLDLSTELADIDAEYGRPASFDFDFDLSASQSHPSWASSVQIWEGDERFANVMLPDRPMDMQLSAFNSTTVLHENIPSELDDYASKLIQCSDWFEATSRPVPPLQIQYRKRSYILDWDATVNSSFHAIGDGTVSDPMEATVDSLTDFETKEHLRTCALVCPESNVELAWNKFLDHCDRISRAKRPTSEFVYPHSLDSTILEDDNIQEEI